MKQLIISLATVVMMLPMGEALGATKSPAKNADTAAFDQKMQPILQSYLKISEDLAKDSAKSAKPDADAILQAVEALTQVKATGARKTTADDLRKAAKALAGAKDITKARQHFQALSEAMVAWAKQAKPAGVRVAYCPMAVASWLQKSNTIRNPYFGKEMPTCGEFVSGD